MVDLHSHVLPQIDDGPKNFKESLEMLDAIKSQGVTKLVLTPHFYPLLMSVDEFYKRREKSFSQIKNYDMDFYLGAEVLYSPTLATSKELANLCIGDTKWLLLELPYTETLQKSMIKHIEQIMSYQSINIIIAHIERYKTLSMADLSVLREIGCLFQINSKLILSNKLRDKMLLKKLYNHGFIDFIASDCHNMVSRRPTLLAAYSKLSSYNEGLVKQLKLNAENIIHSTSGTYQKDFLLPHDLLQKNET